MKKQVISTFILTACSFVLLTGCGTKQVEPAKQDSAANTFEPVVLEIENKEPKVSTVSVLMVGDNLIHSPLYKSGLQSDGTYNFDHLFKHVKDDVEKADLAIINQETIFVSDKNSYSSYPMFGTPDAMGHAIKNAGFDIVAHATNHTIDKKLTGITDTINFWETNYPDDITYLGIHNSKEDSDIEYISKNGIDFAFVNYTYGLNGLESWRSGNEHMIDMLTDNDIEKTLSQAEESADLTVAILHVGTEYVYEPTAYAKEQVVKFIDNGADIVLCAHPHVIEPYEVLETKNGNTGLVYYSLGNFISSQDEIPRIVGGMAEIKIQKKEYRNKVEFEIADYTMTPLITHQESSNYTTYKLDDYTNDLCRRHLLYRTRRSFDCDYLEQFFNDIANKGNKGTLLREIEKHPIKMEFKETNVEK